MAVPIKDFVKEFRDLKNRVRRLELREIPDPVASGGAIQYIEREGVYDTIQDHTEARENFYLTFEYAAPYEMIHSAGGGFYTVTASSAVAALDEAYKTQASDPLSDSIVSNSPSFIAIEQPGVYMVNFSGYFRWFFAEEPVDGVDVTIVMHVDGAERVEGGTGDLTLVRERVEYHPGHVYYAFNEAMTFTLLDNSVDAPSVVSVLLRFIGYNNELFFADQALKLQGITPSRMSVIKLGEVPT